MSCDDRKYVQLIRNQSRIRKPTLNGHLRVGFVLKTLLVFTGTFCRIIKRVLLLGYKNVDVALSSASFLYTLVSEVLASKSFV